MQWANGFIQSDGALNTPVYSLGFKSIAFPPLLTQLKYYGVLSIKYYVCKL